VAITLQYGTSYLNRNTQSLSPYSYGLTSKSLRRGNRNFLLLDSTLFSRTCTNKHTSQPAWRQISTPSLPPIRPPVHHFNRASIIPTPRACAIRRPHHLLALPRYLSRLLRPSTLVFRTKIRVVHPPAPTETVARPKQSGMNVEGLSS